MRFLLSTGIGFRTHTLREVEHVALSEGYDGLELNMIPRNLPEREARRDMNYEDIASIRAVHAPSDLYDGPRFFSALADAVALAENIDAPIVVIHPPALSQGGRANVEKGIELIKKYQAKTTVTIAFEVLVNPDGIGRDRHSYFEQQQAYHTVDDWVADVERYGLAVTLDTTHLGSWGADLVEITQRLGDHVVHVHLSDYKLSEKQEHVVPGEGDLDLGAFLQSLHTLGPDLTVTIELHPPESRKDVISVVRASMAFIRQHI